jgi:AraC-like DNA-binding protein
MLPGGDWIAVEAIPSGLPAVGHRVHDRFAAVLVLAGSGTLDDAAGRRHAIAPGQVFLHLPGVPHRIQRHGAGGWRQLLLRLSAGAWEALRTFAVPPEGPVIQPGPDFGLALLRLQRLLADRTVAPARRLIGLAEACPPLATAPAGDALAEAARLLAADHSARLDLRALAAGCGWSYVHFRRAFRLRHGVPPAAWRRRHRLAEAVRLREAGGSLAGAARRLGWRNPAALGRLLRGGGAAGISPGPPP